MQASRAAMNHYYSDDTKQRLIDSCWELVQLYKQLEVGEIPRNLHILHYEDLATDLLKAAANIYRCAVLLFAT